VVSPCSDRIARVPPYSRLTQFEIRTGLSPAKARLSNRFRLKLRKHWPGPRSLATTNGVSFDVLSSGYLDVSVPQVSFCFLCIQKQIPSFDICKSEPWNCIQNSELQISKVGFPIRKFTDQCLFAAPHDLSQRTTSFIASQRQGIHRIPLRHLIALIIDARRSARKTCCPIKTFPLEMFRHGKQAKGLDYIKTSLLQIHPRTVRSCSAH
jgi:hypothetical protein